MKTKIYFIILFLFWGISVQAQLRGQMQFTREMIKTDKVNGFDKIIGGDGFSTENPGSPELPVLLKSYLIPADADGVTINVQHVSKQKAEGQYDIYPVQPPVPVDAMESISFIEPDPEIYESEAPFPGKAAEIICDEFYMGYRIVTVRLYPLEYLPKRKELYTCHIDFSIDYTLAKSPEKEAALVTQHQSLYRYELNKKSVRFRVENPEAVDNYDTKVQKVVQGKTVIHDFSAVSNGRAGLRSQAVSVIDEQVPDYIIITDSTLKPSFQPLADWKTKKGIFTVIKTVEEIAPNYQGSDLQEKIRKYIIESRSKWGDGLYVLLGGGVNTIPARMVNGIFMIGGNNHQLSFPTDMYYATYVNDWNYNRNSKFNEFEYTPTTNLDSANYSLGVILGRVPVENETEASVWVNKVLAYEKADIGDLNYLKNNLYSDAYMSGDNVLSDFAIKYIKDSVSKYVPNHINNRFICDDARCSGNPKYTVTCPPGVENGDIELNRDNFLWCLNSGANLGVGKFHFIYHMDHGSVNNIATSGKDKGQNVNNRDMDSLKNGISYQILLSSSCHPANFVYDCFGKHYLKNPNGGGVAFIGNTDSGWTGEYSQLGYFLRALYTTNHPTLGRYDIGSVYQYSLDGSSTGHAGFKTKWRLHLLGDPEMQVWTNTPQTFNVTPMQASVQAGSVSLPVVVSGLSLPAGDTALICIQKGTEVYETQLISGNGTYTFPIDIETTGTVNVTATAHNYFPVEKTVTVTTSTAPNPVIQSVNFVDDGTNGSTGNSNERNDAGETICLQVELKNTGLTTANGLTATLSTTSICIDTILINSTTFGTISSGNAATGQFLYKIDKDAPETLANDGSPVQFKLELRDASNTLWTRTFNIDVFATELEQRNKNIISTSGSLVTFNVELQNMGQAPSTVLTTTLKVNNVVSGSANSYPAIGRFETQTATSAFQFTIPSSYTATNTPLKLEVTNTYGKVWIFDFTLAKPDTVTKLDFTANQTEINLTWNAPAGSVGGYNIYRCDVVPNDTTESGSYEKLNTEPVNFSFFTDIGLDSLTKYYYKITAISPSGMESDSVRILAWTSYGTKYYFPITADPTLGRIFSPFSIADVNMDGKKEIFVGTWKGQIGWLMGFDYQGNELFDIDNNVTTVSGFAELSGIANAGAALADIKRDGNVRVIMPTRNMSNASENKLYCYSVEDNDGDGKPDLVWSVPIPYPSWRGSVAANIDNSSDGSMEIIVSPDGGMNPILIYSADGQLLQSISPGVDANYGAIAVADLDGDGDLEIIRACGNGVYVWHHDGTNFISGKQPVYSNPAYNFQSSVVVCDLKGDGEKVILTSAYNKINNKDTGVILAIDTTGALIQGWDSAHQTISYVPVSSNNFISSQEIAVGDIYGNGELKVVVAGVGEVKVWNRDGNLLETFNVPNLTPQLITPLLADVDGDNEAEILFGSINLPDFYAYKLSTGEKALGFPLKFDLEWSPAIADVDGDGKNELLIGKKETGEINMFATSGRPDRIEWGSERYNPRNTGEYSKPCEPTIILSNTTWNSNNTICGDIYVKSGTLTLTNGCTITMSNTSSIIVMAGATLHINNGNLLNTNVNVMPQGNLLQDNNGKIKLRENARFNIQSGATWSVPKSGTVE